MKQHSPSGAGSLEMLLDTMCNTFGGVCFIALMVAIISAFIPAAQDAGVEETSASEQMIINKEIARLTRERDELKSAIAIQKAFIATNTTTEAKVLSAAKLASNISSNANAIAKLKREKIELEDKLAKLTTDISYNTSESKRLERLLREMKEKLGNPANMKNRPFRTPVEHEEGYTPFDVWIRNGRMYCLRNTKQIDQKIIEGVKGKEWEYRVRFGAGFLMDEAFFHSPVYLQLMENLRGQVFMRIFCDKISFPQLCNLRDDLIRRRKFYNWYFSEAEVLHFVEGSDGKVQ